MRRLIVSSFVSLDGVIGDPRAWASEYFDEQAVQKSLAVLQSCDAMLMGTNTYEYFAPAWSAATDPYGARITAMPKYVFSSSLTSAEWNNTIVVSADAVAAAAELKQQDGGDLIMYGYGRLAQAFLEHGLVDELNIGIHPVIVGHGTPLFRPGPSKAMQLTAVERSATGVVSLTYSA